MSDSDNINALIVSVQLNACYVAGSQTVTDAKADFSRLPWSNGQEDFNSSTPFLGESVLSPPFQDRNFELAEGVHLHWVLPKAHRTYPAGSHNPPAAPNCWLISKVGTSDSWIVESDYINENSTIYNRNAVTIPSKNLGASTGQPFVYLGRQMRLEAWQNEANPPSSDSYFPNLNGKPLSAFGYGELSFNTFYPNCRSVFGFFDPAGTFTSEYEVMGWYSQSDNNDISSYDIVRQTHDKLYTLLSFAKSDPYLLNKVCDDQGKCPEWLNELITKARIAVETHIPLGNEDRAAINWLKASSYGTSDYYKDLNAQVLADQPAFSIQTLINFLFTEDQTVILNLFFNYGIQQALNWTYTTGATPPQSSLYYSYITLNDTAIPPTFNDVAIGHTGTEALSAYLANNLDSLSKSKVTADASAIEQGLNTLLMGSSVQRDLVDLDDNLKESHHNQGFKAIDSGLIWRIRKMKDTGVDASEPGKGCSADRHAQSIPAQRGHPLSA